MRPFWKPSVTATRSQVKRLWRRHLLRAGWTIERRERPNFDGSADLMVEQEGRLIALKYSGTDMPLNTMHVRNLCNLAIGGICQPVFVYGDAAVDLRALDVARERSALLIHFRDVGRLQAGLEAIPGKVTGKVEAIHRSGVISGWAKLSHNNASVRVVAVVGGEPIGEAVADGYRKDLESVGDGRCAFRIETAPIEGSLSDFVGKVCVWVFSNTAATPKPLATRENISLIET
jgi:hypothetical protein